MSNSNENTPHSPRGCVIWMHGLGADASDMAGLAEQGPLAGLSLKHVFPDAPVRPVTLNAGMPMRAWYDITGFKRTDREDRQGIQQSEAQIRKLVDAQLNEGFHSSDIVLAGFSQGGAVALYTALHCDMPLGGVIALSSYLPLASECQPVLAKNTPVFLGYGQFDTLVLPEFTKVSETWLRATGYDQLTVRSYPMEHSVCAQEIGDMAQWLSMHLRGVGGA